MADNVGYSEGFDATIATDEIGGVHHQKILLEFGPDGTATRVSPASPLPVVDPMLELARGVAGYTIYNKFGGNPSVTSATEEVVWDGGGTSYPWPTTATITHVSTTADDATMRGETIEVQGLDAGWNLVVQTVVLDGTDTTTQVALFTPLLRVFRARVLANVVAAQAINVESSGGGTVYATIQAGNNQTQMALFTIPANMVGYMTQYYAGAIPAAANDPRAVKFRLWTADRENGYEFQLKHFKAATDASTDVTHDFKPYFQIPAKTDIMITAAPSNQDCEVFAGFDLIIGAI